MRSISVSDVLSPGKLKLRALVFVLGAFFAVSTIYLVGLEPMVYLHDTFHDVRHSTGFPCH
ncbi:CbtB domain-containing protein [Leptospira sarikeiensis]|uniref:CbtB-domain containing protein n=1 Tax=Leptospira sarikeiensis TaxID=2484943 RepID=A0A4R9JYT1_9LEPT|nr:CbtB domain-containing protein [Leptospira sarikeiensis]TGL58411.1 CbtB-domain containing protein [Leptospira sarikeiensis]